MAFRVEQKVVCVNDAAYRCEPTLRGHPLKGEVITIGGFADDGCVYIEECGVGDPHPGFYAYRFRPLQERRNDKSTFVENLKKICAPKELEKVRRELVDA